jgi:hypothetical protein
MPDIPEIRVFGLIPLLPLVHLLRWKTRALLSEGLDTFSPGEVDFMMVDFID